MRPLHETLMHLLHSWSVDSRMAWKFPRYAALLQRISIRPFVAAAASTARLTSAVEDTSACEYLAASRAPPAATMLSPVALPASSSISVTRTQAPSSANSSLMALPIPLAPPVTIATLSFSLSMFGAGVTEAPFVSCPHRTVESQAAPPGNGRFFPQLGLRIGPGRRCFLRESDQLFQLWS